MSPLSVSVEQAFDSGLRHPYIEKSPQRQQGIPCWRRGLSERFPSVLHLSSILPITIRGARGARRVVVVVVEE